MKQPNLENLFQNIGNDPTKVFGEVEKMMKGLDKPKRRRFEFKVIQGSIQKAELTDEEKQLKEAERIIRGGQEDVQEVHAEIVENESLKWVWYDLIVGAERLTMGDLDRAYLDTTIGTYETPYTYEELNKMIDSVD